MVSLMVIKGERKKRIVFTEYFEDIVTFVVAAWGTGGIGITFYIDESSWVDVCGSINSSLERPKSIEEVGVMASSRKIDVDVNCSLVARNIEHYDSYSTGFSWKNTDVGVKISFPEGESSTMSSCLKKGELRVIDIIGVEEQFVVRMEELCNKLGITLKKPWFRQQNEVGRVSINNLSDF